MDMRRFDKIARKSPEEVEAIQQQNIRSTIEYALARSSFYNNLYGGRRADDLLKEGFSYLPFTDKTAIMDNFNSVVTSPQLNKNDIEKYLSAYPVGTKYKGRYTTIHTSGTSGKIGIFTYDSPGWDSLVGLCISRATNYRLSLKRIRLAFIGLTDGHYAGITLASAAPRLLAVTTFCSVNEPAEKVVERLNKFRPDDLRGYPSGLTVLASEQLAGRLHIKPKTVVSSAEPLEGRTRHLIEEAFGLEPYNFYAASESLCIAQDCYLHRGLHVFNDQNVIELVDSIGNPVEPGKPGEVVLTNLYNRCQPIIRYKMHDIAIYSEETCECGLPFPLLKAVGGRRDEMLWVENGSGGYEVIHPMVFVEFFIPGLRGLQVQQLERNRLRLLVAAEGNPEVIVVAARERMREILSGKGLQDVVEFDVVPVESILPDSKTGKTRLVITHVGPPKGVW